MYLTKKYCKESGDWLQQSKAHEFIFVALQNITVRIGLGLGLRLGLTIERGLELEERKE